jgi:hypothetical protein
MADRLTIGQTAVFAASQSPSWAERRTTGLQQLRVQTPKKPLGPLRRKRDASLGKAQGYPYWRLRVRPRVTASRTGTSHPRPSPYLPYSPKCVEKREILRSSR